MNVVRHQTVCKNLHAGPTGMPMQHVIRSLSNPWLCKDRAPHTRANGHRTDDSHLTVESSVKADTFVAACIWESVGNHVPLSAKTAGDKPPHHGGVQIRCGFGSLHFTSGKERGTSPRATAEYKYDAASGVSTLRQAKSGGQAPALRRSTNTMRLRESPLYVRQKAGDKPPRYGGVQIRCGFGSLHFTSGKERGTSPRAAEYKYDAASGVSTLRPRGTLHKS